MWLSFQTPLTPRPTRHLPYRLRSTARSTVPEDPWPRSVFHSHTGGWLSSWGVEGEVSCGTGFPQPAAISMSTSDLALSQDQTSLGRFTLRPGLTQVAWESFGHCLPCYNHQCPCHSFFLQPHNTDSCSPLTPRQVSNDQQREECFQIF